MAAAMMVRMLVGAVTSFQPIHHEGVREAGSGIFDDGVGSLDGHMGIFDPVLRIGQPARVSMLLRGGRQRLRRTVQVVRVDDDAGGPMVERLHHLPLVERHPLSRGAVEAVAADRPGAFPLLQLLPGAEPAGVVRHVEHSNVPHRPGPDLLAGGTVHEHGQAPVDRGRQLGVPPGAEDRGGAGVRIDRGEVFRREREAVVGVRKLGYVVQVERAAGRLGEWLPARDEDAELEGCMDIREEHLLVLEVVQRPQAALGRDRAEEGGGGLVGGDAGRGQQTDHSPRADERHRPLHEQGVEVHVAAGQPGIVAARARHPEGGIGPLVRPLEVGGERISAAAQRPDHALAVRGALGVGDLRAAGGEPLHLLELHPVPGRVADDRVEAPVPLDRIPIRPDARKGDLPVEEPLLRDEIPCTRDELPRTVEEQRETP